MKIIKFIFFITFFNAVSATEVTSTNTIPEGVESIVAVIPIFSQKVSFNLPTSWKAAFEDQQPGAYMIEFIPQSESIENWNNLLTIQGFENLADKTTPESFLDGLVGHMKGICSENLVYEKLEQVTISGHPAYLAIIGCSNTTGPKGNNMSEVGYYISLQGKHDHYLIHKDVRGNPFGAGNSPINRNNAAEFMREFLPIELCQAGGEPYECNK